MVKDIGRHEEWHQTENEEPNRHLNTKTNKGKQETNIAHQDRVREETGGSGGHHGQDMTKSSFQIFGFMNIFSIK